MLLSFVSTTFQGFFEARAEVQKYFRWLFGLNENFAFEINRPLDTYYLKDLTLHFAEPALYDVSGEQKWIRGTANSEGYFTLQNPTSGKFLTAASPTITTISGTYIQNFYK